LSAGHFQAALLQYHLLENVMNIQQNDKPKTNQSASDQGKKPPMGETTLVGNPAEAKSHGQNQRPEAQQGQPQKSEPQKSEPQKSEPQKSEPQKSEAQKAAAQKAGVQKPQPNQPVGAQKKNESAYSK
jgi:hypothetical protein